MARIIQRDDKPRTYESRAPGDQNAHGDPNLDYSAQTVASAATVVTCPVAACTKRAVARRDRHGSCSSPTKSLDDPCPALHWTPPRASCDMPGPGHTPEGGAPPSRHFIILSAPCLPTPALQRLSCRYGHGPAAPATSNPCSGFSSFAKMPRRALVERQSCRSTIFECCG